MLQWIICLLLKPGDKRWNTYYESINYGECPDSGNTEKEVAEV